MAYRAKKTSAAVKEAKPRLAAMQQIEKTRNGVVNYGDDEKPLTAAVIESKMKAIDDNIAKYNQQLSEADSTANTVEVDEKELKTMLSDVLAAGKRKFGRDSSEVEQLGGTRTSERARPRARVATGTNGTTAA